MSQFLCALTRHFGLSRALVQSTNFTIQNYTKIKCSIKLYLKTVTNLYLKGFAVIFVYPGSL